MSTPIHLFFSYAANDESLRSELEAQLANLKRQGRIRSFDQRMVGPGQVRNAVLAERFKQAQVILLLIIAEEKGYRSASAALGAT